MIRKIIKIDEKKCNGCGLCAQACHEGAIGMVNGKAKLMRDDYCDGLGDCLPVCPTEAISFENREAAEYDKEAVEKNMKQATENKKKNMGNAPANNKVRMGCPGSNAHAIQREKQAETNVDDNRDNSSRLNQWPVQIKLVPINAPYFDGARLLIAADCAAYAHGNFHNDFMKNKVTIIGCPKLDEVDYSEKLTAILQQNDIKSVTVVRMQVPCCGGIQNAVQTALKNSGKMIPWQVVTISTDGKVLED